MRVPVNRLHLDRLFRQWSTSQQIHKDYHLMSESKVDFLPELPPAPRYPCPFLTATDILTYVLPLYRFGWGVSRVSNDTHGTMPTPPATRLSKRLTLPNPDIADKLVRDITNTIIEPENHHPILEQHQNALSIVDIHVHTHTARAPPDRQNIDDRETFTRKRPGITHRDIRFAILVERLLLDGDLVDSPAAAFYPQPIDIDTLHNFRTISPEVRDSTIN